MIDGDVMGNLLADALKFGDVEGLRSAYDTADEEAQTRLTVALVCVENKLEKFVPLSTTEGRDPVRP